LVSVKLPVSDPSSKTRRISSGVFRTFVRVMVCGGLEVPTLKLPKLKVDGDSPTGAAVAVRVTVCGLPAALSAILSVPEAAPPTLALKATPTLQVAAG
jgi:ABC-type uncharacterized transport system permease subunit